MKDATYLTNKKFSEFDLHPTLLHGLEDAGFEHCTPIQAETLPLLLTGQDVAGQAQTGTGKTAAFLLATFSRLLTNPPLDTHQSTSVRAVILAPTRELAIQIYRDAEVLGKHSDLKLGLVYGGTGYHSQRESLSKGVDILIGTPGRLIDYFKQGVFDLKGVQAVVLDEADRMFDLGFIKDIRFVLRRMPGPSTRLNMLFSATLSLRVNELAYEHMNNPTEVKIQTDTPVADRLIEEVYYPANNEKLPLLLGLIAKTQGERVLVFANTRVTCDRLGQRLRRHGYSTGVQSGDVPQPKREKLLKEFTEGRCQVLVATDVAARGLHIPSVSQVFNYDLPQDPEDYVHRTGRTARAGASGHAISFACEDHAFSLMDIEAFIGHSLTRKEISDALMVQPETVSSKAQPRERNRKPRPRSARNREESPKPDITASTATPPTTGPVSPGDAQRASRRDDLPEPVPEFNGETASDPAKAPAVITAQPPRPATRRNDFETPAVG